MPITPFHLGPGLLLGGYVRGTFAAFTLANVIIDVESIYHVLTGAYPVHTFLHTFVGATLAAVATFAALVPLELRARRKAVNGPGQHRSRIDVPLSRTAIGALGGAWSHVVFDGVMHADAQPFAPWSPANPLLGLVSLFWLHAFCVATGALAAWSFWRAWGKVRC